MKKKIKNLATFTSGVLFLFWSSWAAHAASLQISPVGLDIPAPGSSAVVNLQNVGTNPVSAQVRVYRWSQQNGEEKLEPSDDVVASPPSVTLAPKSNYAMRVVRISKTPVTAEESYRLLIDELPDPSRQRNGSITLVLRYSVPVFFPASESGPPKLTWSIEKKGAKTMVAARNDGDRHVRLSVLKIRDHTGHAVSFGAGLLGYALGHSTMKWTAPGKSVLGAGAISVSAQSDLGPIDAQASIQH